jgi:hypothetical protein
MSRPAPIIAGTLAALLLLFVAYMGGYYAMLKGKDLVGPPGRVIPIYRLHSHVVVAYFTPANTIDRVARPVYWDFGRTFFGQ